MVVENKKLKDKIFIGIIVTLILLIIGLLIANRNNKTQLNSDNKNINSATNKKLVSNVSFSSLNTCSNGKVILSNKNGVLYNCISEYNLHGTYKSMQDFAVTDNYVYFSSPLEGAWSSADQIAKKGKDAEYTRITRTYVVRVPKKENQYSFMYINYGGHGQSFDAVSRKNDTDQLFGNAFAYIKETTLNNKPVYGSFHNGVYVTTFKENQSINGTTRVPGVAVALSNSGKTLALVNSGTYLKNDKFDSTAYYNKIKSITNQLASAKGKVANPEVAVDEDRDRIAVVSGKNVYVYDLSDFKKGNANMVYKSFNIDESKQGVELYGNSLYIYSGGVEKPITLTRYNITNGKKVKSVTFDLKNYYTNRPIPRYDWEAEGISIYKGHIYVGVVNRKCIQENNDKVNKSCVKSETYNEIFEIDNF